MLKLAQLVKYAKVLAKRVHRPLRPLQRLTNPLLKRIRLRQLGTALAVIGLAGSYQYWRDFSAYQQSLRKKAVLEQQISFWENELKQKPQSRDVMLKLALLYYQIRADGRAVESWQKASYLDPLNPEVQKVGAIISSRP